MKTDLLQSCGHCWVFQICWHIEYSTSTASSFRIWNSSTGILSLPLALFIVMLPKAHLTSHPRMSGSRWVITPSWLSGQSMKLQSQTQLRDWTRTRAMNFPLSMAFAVSHNFWYGLFLFLEKAMAPHSSTLAWKIPWTEEPGRLQSMGLLRVGHDWATSLSTCMHWRRKWQPTPVILTGESQGWQSPVLFIIIFSLNSLFAPWVI